MEKYTNEEGTKIIIIKKQINRHILIYILIFI